MSLPVNSKPLNEKRELEPLNEERERERERKMRRLQLETEERRAKEELEFRKLELERKSGAKETIGDAKVKPKVVAKAKLPPFQDGKDDSDSYLQRFERFARTSGWVEDQWAPALSTLLTGKALEVYSRTSDAAATDYRQLREALFRRYDLTKDRTDCDLDAAVLSREKFQSSSFIDYAITSVSG